MDSQEDSDLDQENDGSDDESRALEERLLEAEARRKRYTKRLDDHENVGSSRGGDARHRKRPERKDVEEQNASDSEEKEAIPRGGRVGRMRAQFLGWQSQGMRNTNLALAVLGSCLLTVICIFWLHYSQEVEYWKELEGVVRSERAAREEAQRAAEEVQRTSAAEVQKLTAAMPSALASTTPLSCPPVKECPKPTKCPPVEAATPPAQSAQKANELDFKVYVYDLPSEFHSDLKRDQRRCINDQYGTEIRFHENLLQSSFRTTNPDEAEFFFVPIYGECYLFRENQLAGKQALANTNRWYRKALSIVWHDYPMWNRTQGRDHIFVFAGARGPHIFQDWKKNIKKSIFLTPEGDRSLSEQFNTWKDVVIPGLENEPYYTTGENAALPLEKRHIFAFFRGTIHNKGGSSYSRGIRIKMEAAFKNEKDVVFGEAVASCDRKCYRDSMAHSTFCLCPRGWSPWTLRAYQAMMVGCIPVVIADEIEFPYENSMDWRELTVKIPERRSEETISILRSIPKERILEKQEAIKRARLAVTWKEPPVEGDAFHSTLKEIGRKRRNFKASTFTFWN